MLEDEIYKIIKKIKGVNHSKKIDYDKDMFRSGYLDSLEMINLVMQLEKKFKFKYDLFEEKYKIISINNLKEFIGD
jgi:acyl carrier protein